MRRAQEVQKQKQKEPQQIYPRPLQAAWKHGTQARGQPRKAVSSGGLDAILGVMPGSLSSAGEQNEVKNPQIPTAGELRGGAGALLWGRTEKAAKEQHQRAAGGFVPRVLPKKLKSAGMGAQLPGSRTPEVSAPLQTEAASVLSRPWHRCTHGSWVCAPRSNRAGAPRALGGAG